MHELLTVAECRQRGISYLNPNATSYCGWRFNVMDGDTQVPVIGSGEKWDRTRLVVLADAISQGCSHPVYITRPTATAARMRQLGRAGGYALKTMGWLLAERFNTSSPMRKVVLQRRQRENLRTWAKLAQIPIVAGPVIL